MRDRPPAWNAHDVFVKAQLKPDRLWIGLFGIDPDGQFIGYRLLPDDEIARRAEFIGVGATWADDAPRGYGDMVRDWLDEMRNERFRTTWEGSFASAYAFYAHGEGRYTCQGATTDERVASLDSQFDWFTKGAP